MLKNEEEKSDYEFALLQILHVIREPSTKRDSVLTLLNKGQILKTIENAHTSFLSDETIQKICLQILQIILKEKNEDQIQYISIYRLVVNTMNSHITNESIQVDGMQLLKILSELEDNDGRQLITESQQRETLKIAFLKFASITGSIKMKVAALQIVDQIFQTNPSLLDIPDNMIHMLPGFCNQDGGCNQDLIEAVLPIYLLMSKVEKYRSMIIASDIPKLLQDFAVDNITCEKILDLILNIFVNMIHKGLILYLIDCGFISKTLFNVMNTYNENASISIAGFKILKMAAPLYCERSSMKEWMAILYKSGFRHFTSPEIQIALYEAASAILKNDPEFISQIGEDVQDNQYPLQSFCLGSFFQHKNNMDVFVANCETIYWMASGSVNLADLMMQKNTFVEILEKVRIYKGNAAVVLSGCRAVKGLCIFSPPERRLSVGKHKYLMNIFCEIFSNYQQNPAIIMEAICLVACFADVDILYNPSLIWKAVSNAIVTHPDYVLVQESALEVLAVTIHKECTSSYQLDNEYLNQILDILKKFPENLCIQRKGLYLLQLLTHVIPEDFKIDEMAKMIVDLMKKNPYAPSIQVESCILIVLLGDYSKTESFIRHDCQTPVFAIFMNYSDFPEILDIAYQCLFVLSHENKKSIMLLRACAAKSFIEVECLVHLNADVNYKENGYTPLLYACENGDEKIVSCLLTKEIADLLTPLKVACEKNYNNIVGLLLKHIGQEPETQSIYWNNLGLGNLNKDWLLPTFVKNASSHHSLTGIGKKIARQIQAFCMKYFDANESFISYSSNNSSNSDSCSSELTNRKTLVEIELREWQQTTLTGAVIPFHIHDPRIYRRDLQIIDAHCRGQTTGSSLKNMEEFWLRKKCFLSDNSPPETGTLSFGECAIIDMESQNTNQECLKFFQPVHGLALTQSLKEKMTPSKNEAMSSDNFVRRNKYSNLDSIQSMSLLRTKSCSFPVSTLYEDQSQDKIQTVDISHNNCANLNGLTILQLTHPLCLNSLQELNISHNQLTSLPDYAFNNLQKLQKLDLSSNQFQLFPSDILKCPQLEILKLGYNKLEDTMESKLPISFSLKKLDLSGNHFKVFPSWISDFMPGLERLHLKSTKMERINNEPLQLKRLLKLDLSNNSIQVLPDKFFIGCNNLMILKAINNKLVQLPSEELSLELPQLQELYLSNNKLTERKPFFISKFITNLPCLTFVDLCNNKLKGICPPIMWMSKDLKKLMLSKNQISHLNLSEGAIKWKNLEVLDISYNKLKSLPPEIGYLTSLRCLDFSYNPEIRYLPDELGYCEKIWEMPLDGLESLLNIHLSKGKVCDLILYLNHKLKKVQSYYQMKMMVVGFGGHGKTTLLRSLMQEKKPVVATTTVGIHVKDWKFNHKRENHSVEYTISTWDFAGQEEFYSIHQCFLSTQGIYLVVYDVRCKDIEILKCWLANIHAQAPDCPIVVVGTHKDLISEDENTLKKIKRDIKALQIKPDFPVIHDVILVDSRNENKDISHLRIVIKQVINNYKVRGQHVMGQKIPATYIKLAKLVSNKAASLKNEYPVLTRKEMLALLKHNQLNMTSAEFNQAIRFFNEMGVLRHFDEASNQLKDLYFIDPAWLCRMLAQVATVEEINPYINKSGIMKKEDLKLLLTGKCADSEKTYIFPPSKIPQFLKLLEKFEIALPQNEEELLIPFRLPISHPDVSVPNCNSIKRIYRMFFIPIGLWSRLITRILAFSKKKTILSMSNPERLECYRHGIFAYWSKEKYFYLKEEHKKRNEIVIQVPNTIHGCRMIGEMIDHLDSLIEEWYPGLLISDAYGVCPLEKLVPCPDCKEDGKHFFNLDDLIHESDKNNEIKCPVHKDSVLLASMAPDVMLSDLAEELLLQQNQFYLQQSPRNLLGHGQFGKVYQAIYKNQSVAVKLFTNIGDYHPRKMLRKEVTVMMRLKHPSVVSLLAVGLHPCLIVMERAHYGSLKHVLDNRKSMKPLLIQRIALQVAEGLMYLHQQMIIYRDLKPSNILVFSLCLTSLINVKISDYGISQLIAPYGLTAKEGTRGYQAPEVARRENYSFQADIFSYGIMLYMLLSGGKHPFDHLKDAYEIEQAILDEQSISLPSCKNAGTWPDMLDILHQCLDHNPDRRPTAEQVCKHLKNPETISLKQIILVTKSYSIDCMIVTEDTNYNLTLWVTSGNDQNIQLSWLKPNDSSVEVAGKILDIHRPLCLLSVNNIILLGCISGRIEVFHADKKQHLHSSSQSSEAVLSIFCFHGVNHSDLILAGSADGSISVFLLESLINDEDCKPLFIQKIQFHEPVMCLCQYDNVIYASCGDSVFKLNLPVDITNLDKTWPRFEIVKMKMGHSLFPVNQEIPNINTMALFEKMMYITRRNDSTIEIWDILKEKYENYVNIFNFLTGCDVNQARITATLLDQTNSRFWVGTGGGHLVLLECHTLQLLRVICRHPNPIRSLLLYTSPEPYASEEDPVVVCGTYDVRIQQGISEAEKYGCVSVWDTHIVEYIERFEEEAKKRHELANRTNHV